MFEILNILSAALDLIDLELNLTSTSTHEHRLLAITQDLSQSRGSVCDEARVAGGLDMQGAGPREAVFEENKVYSLHI